MSAQPTTTDRLRNYLLGTLVEDERQALEVELLRDDALCEELQALEDEALHDWAQGGEGAAELEPVVARLLRTPAGRRRLVAARQLVAGLATPLAAGRGSGSERWVGWLAAAAAVLLIGGAAWWLAPRFAGDRLARGEGTEVPAVAAPGSTAAPGSPDAAGSPAPAAAPPPPAGLRPSRESAVQPLVAVLALTPGLVRDGGGAPRVSLSPEVETLRLTLRLPPEVPAGVPYTLSLLSADGVELWQGVGLRESAGEGAPVLVADLPAGRLPEGDYELVLGLEAAPNDPPVADYAFGVLRER